ncbi:MAG: hypothetical protein K0R43_1671 [Pseudoduganella sp.]|jgi:hypothetical protein|nr:hypothetical protein [Pseudoduganella sp.]
MNQKSTNAAPVAVDLSEKDWLNIKLAAVHLGEAKFYTAAENLFGILARRRERVAAQVAPVAMSLAAAAVLAERRRQVEQEDWSHEHDDAHPCGEIAAFAAVYAMPPAARDWPAEETGYGATFGEALCPEDWTPKFGDRRRELVKAGALILAEIERLDRADIAANPPKGDTRHGQ